MKHARHDTKLEAAVNKGLAVALLENIPAGAKVMEAGGVGREIIARVLLDPQRRRATDWKNSPTSGT